MQRGVAGAALAAAVAGGGLDPFLGQAALPLRGPAGRRAQRGDFGPQGFHLGRSVEPKDPAPLARRLITGLLQRAAAHQRQQREVEEDRFQRIIAWRQGVNHPRVAQEPFGEQRGQGAEHARLQHVVGGGKLQRRAVQQTAGRQHPVHDARRPVAQAAPRCRPTSARPSASGSPRCRPDRTPRARPA